MKVVVIGCGLAGLSTAYFLDRAGAEVIVLDRAAGPARETSFANGSMITPSLADPWNAPGVLRTLLSSIGDDSSVMRLHLNQVLPLAGWGIRFLWNSRRAHFERSFLENVLFSRYSQAVMRDLLQVDPIDFEYAPDGILKIFEDPAALDHAVNVAHWLKQAGVRHERLDTEALVELEPALYPIRARLVGAVRYPDDEVGNARLFCEGLKRVLEGRGVRFRFSEQVLRFDRRRKRLEAVHTPSGRLEADAYVLAAGSFSPVLARELKFRIPVVPVKGYSLTVRVAGDGVLPRFAVVDDAMHAAVVPLGGDRLRIAGTAEFAGYDTQVRPERTANLSALLERLYPEIVPGKTEGWAGLRPMTSDGRCILGRSPIENLFLNTGHGALGWTMACGSGKVVAEAVLGTPLSYDTAPFELSPRRRLRN